MTTPRHAGHDGDPVHEHPDVERATLRQPSPMASHLKTLEKISTSRRDGVLLVVEAESVSLKMLGRAAESSDGIGEILLRAFDLIKQALPTADWSRVGWSRIETALPGTRGELIDVACRMVRNLLDDPAAGQLRWHSVLVRILPGDPLRTLQCDPGYDLAGAEGSLVAWVEPYSGNDWKEAGQYPTTTIVWHHV